MSGSKPLSLNLNFRLAEGQVSSEARQIIADRMGGIETQIRAVLAEAGVSVERCGMLLRRTATDELADHPLWEETRIAKAIEDRGLTDPDEIDSYVQETGSNQDYLTWEDETLESLVRKARRELGIRTPSRAEQIQTALEAAGVEPDLDEEDALDGPR